MEFIAFIIDFIIYADIHLARWVALYGVWIYIILFLIIFCETALVIMPFLPGDSLLFVTGALAALPDNDLNIHLVAILLLIAAIIGDAVNYQLGYLFGAKIFSNPDSLLFRRSYLIKAQQFYQKQGAKAIILARFIPIMRTFAPFAAGMSRMSHRHFMTYNVIGALMWIGLFSYTGYLFGNAPLIQKNLTFFIISIIFVSLLPAFIELWRQVRLSLQNKT